MTPPRRCQLLAGLSLFGVQAFLIALPATFGIYDFAWPLLIVSFGAMVITPLALEVLRLHGCNIRIPVLVLAVAWIGMIGASRGGGGLAALPWLFVTLWIAGQAVQHFCAVPAR